LTSHRTNNEAPDNFCPNEEGSEDTAADREDVDARDADSNDDDGSFGSLRLLGSSVGDVLGEVVGDGAICKVWPKKPKTDIRCISSGLFLAIAMRSRGIE
jgi:hypothetical protein